MIDLVANHRRKVPVPRRIIRFVAGCSKPVTIATILGIMLRCLYYRDGACAPDGRCKASWIAGVFGVDERNVKAARGYLKDVGWLIVEQSSQTALNRWGSRLRVNLCWQAVQPHQRIEPPRPQRHASPPLAPANPRESPPPRNDRELSSRSIHQKPAPRGSGVCEPALSSAQEAPWPNTGRRVPEEPRLHPSGVSTIPDLRDVCAEDLKVPARLSVLFAQATARGLIDGGEAARLRFFAAAQHALRVGTTNPCGLFAVVVRRNLWRFVSTGDEDRARALMALGRDLQSHRRRPICVPGSGDPVLAKDVLRTLLRSLRARWSFAGSCRSRTLVAHHAHR
ncbi:MAG: hypothetical protein HOP29_02375 [Phycisphaerales bacterium]|nr:hypothetical protein [Phycisphaerales bacterium]